MQGEVSGEIDRLSVRDIVFDAGNLNSNRIAADTVDADGSAARSSSIEMPAVLTTGHGLPNRFQCHDSCCTYEK